MNPAPPILAFTAMDNLGPVFWDILLKGSALLGLSALIAYFFQKTSAAMRHLVWSMSLAAVLALPVLSAALPGWQAGSLVNWLRNEDRGTETQIPLTQDGSNKLRGISAQDIITSEKPASLVTDLEGNETSKNSSRFSFAFLATAISSLSDNIESWVSTWERELFYLWLAGVIAASLFFATGGFYIARFTRSCKPVERPEWLHLLAEIQTSLRIQRGVRLLRSPGSTMPFTWGAFRPVLLVPDVAEEWSESRRRMVLMHELAHVKRLDWLTQTIASLACAVYWFNPLVWLAAKRMRIERERACDDLVLQCGARASDYAEELLVLATRLDTRKVLNWATVPMARQSSLESRLRSILDEKRSRRSLNRVVVTAAALAILLIAGPVAAMRTTASTSSLAERELSVANGTLESGRGPVLSDLQNLKSDETQSTNVPRPLQTQTAQQRNGPLFGGSRNPVTPEGNRSNGKEQPTETVKAILNQALDELRRVEELHQTGSASALEFERAKAGVDAARAVVEGNNAALALAKLRLAEINLRQAEIADASRTISAVDLEQARADVEIAKAEVAKDNKAVAIARIRKAEADLKSKLRLKEQGMITALAVDKARFNLERVRAEAAGDQRGVASVDLKEAETELAWITARRERGVASMEEWERAQKTVRLAKEKLHELTNRAGEFKPPTPEEKKSSGFGTVKGRAFIGASPAGNQRILFDRYFPKDNLRYDTEVVTDDQGYFVAKNVPAGKYRLSRLVTWTTETDRYTDQSGTGSHGIRVEVLAGETSEVRLGGSGRTVTGRLVLANAEGPRLAFTAADFRFLTRTEARDDGYPGSHFVLNIERDGSFRVSDVPAGEYQLFVKVKEAIADRPDAKDSGEVNRVVQIPAGENTNESVDLGEVKLSLLR